MYFLNDFYKKKANKFNLYSRSWFKLYEIDKKYNILKKNINVIELGSSPGGWSKFIKDKIFNGILFSCDIKPMNFKIINFYLGDISNRLIFNKFLDFIKVDYVDVVLSDMLSNTTGFNVIDYNNNINLIKISLDLCFKKLKYGGDFIFKTLINDNLLLKKIRLLFKNIYFFKPNSSRKHSKEFYVISKYFKKNKEVSLF